MSGFWSCKHIVKRSQLPQACLFCFRCTNHSDEPRKNLTRVQQRLPRVTSLLSIVQRQQNQTRLCSRCYFCIWVDSAYMLHSPTKMFRKQYITQGCRAVGTVASVNCDFCPAKCERFVNELHVIAESRRLCVRRTHRAKAEETARHRWAIRADTEILMCP